MRRFSGVLTLFFLINILFFQPVYAVELNPRHLHFPLWNSDLGYWADPVAISSDGYIYAGNYDDTVFIFNPDNSESVETISLDTPRRIEISSDGEYILIYASGESQNLQFYRRLFYGPNEPYLFREWERGFTSGIRDLAISGDGTYSAVAARWDFGLNLYYLLDKTSGATLRLIENSAQYIGVSSDNSYVIMYCGHDTSLKCYAGTSSIPSWNHSVDGGGVRQMVMSDDGQYIAMWREIPGGTDKVVVYNHSGLYWESSPSNIYAIAISPDGRYLAVGGHGFFLLDLSSRVPIFNIADFDVHNIDFSGDGNYLAVSGFETVSLFATQSPTLLWSYPTSSFIGDIAVSTQGDYIAAGNTDGNLYLFHRTKVGSQTIFIIVAMLIIAIPSLIIMRTTRLKNYGDKTEG